jgi:hypothetical protein
MRDYGLGDGREQDTQGLLEAICVRRELQIDINNRLEMYRFKFKDCFFITYETRIFSRQSAASSLEEVGSELLAAGERSSSQR